MFDKNRVHFMNAYYKETEKPYGYLLVDNKPDTPPSKQILADLFGECYVYHFGVNSTKPTRDVPNDVWQIYTLDAQAVRKIPDMLS